MLKKFCGALIVCEFGTELRCEVINRLFQMLGQGNSSIAFHG